MQVPRIPCHQRRPHQRMERNTKSQSRRDSSDDSLLEVPQLRKEIPHRHTHLAERKRGSCRNSRTLSHEKLEQAAALFNIKPSEYAKAIYTEGFEEEIPKPEKPEEDEV